MPIIGVTHGKDGAALMRRSVTTKVAIGIGPEAGRNHPKKLDHFIILRKEEDDGSAVWVEDEVKTKHYGKDPTELVIILLDDDIDEVFRTEYAWWAQTGKKCHGDGEQATRDGEPWANCANSGKCKEYESGECKPSADLYFMLADFPSLGTVCRLHTSSYQSVREVYSALTDLKNMMGGRLMGLPVKLFVRPEKNVYEQGGMRKTGTKYVLGLEIRADSLTAMLENVTESAKVFSDLKKAMGGRRLEIIEDDRARAPEIADEFVHIAGALPAAQIPPDENPEQTKKITDFHTFAEGRGFNKAARHMLIAKHNGDLDKARAEVENSPATGDAPAQPASTAPTTKRGAGKRAGPRASKPEEKQVPAMDVPATPHINFGF